MSSPSEKKDFSYEVTHPRVDVFSKEPSHRGSSTAFSEARKNTQDTLAACDRILNRKPSPSSENASDLPTPVNGHKEKPDPIISEYLDDSQPDEEVSPVPQQRGIHEVDAKHRTTVMPVIPSGVIEDLHSRSQEETRRQVRDAVSSLGSVNLLELEAQLPVSLTEALIEAYAREGNKEGEKFLKGEIIRGLRLHEGFFMAAQLHVKKGTYDKYVWGKAYAECVAQVKREKSREKESMPSYDFAGMVVVER